MRRLTLSWIHLNRRYRPCLPVRASKVRRVSATAFDILMMSIGVRSGGFSTSPGASVSVSPMNDCFMGSGSGRRWNLAVSTPLTVILNATCSAFWERIRGLGLKFS